MSYPLALPLALGGNLLGGGWAAMRKIISVRSAQHMAGNGAGAATSDNAMDGHAIGVRS